MRFLDLFAGIGGFRMGMEQAGHECVGYVEIDKFARKSYEAIFNTKGEWTAHDITTITDNDIRFLRGQVDVICGGFPCQAFSIAGKRGGFQDIRGTMFFEIARITKQIKPRLLLLENVKGLLSHDQGETFRTILSTLDELGYDAEWQVLNSKDFGVPQNRERTFIIGHLRGTSGRKVFPIEEGKKRGKSNKTNYATSLGITTKGIRNWTGSFIVKKNYIQWDASGKGYGSQQDRAFFQNGNIGTLSASNNGNKHKVLLNNRKIRKLTPRECWRLQGFPDWAFDKAAKVNSNSQLYKQAGNSVTVNVIYEIAKLL